MISSWTLNWGVKVARGYCPDCNELKEITPGEQIRPGFSARYWVIVVHKDPWKARLCDGSGKKI